MESVNTGLMWQEEYLQGATSRKVLQNCMAKERTAAQFGTSL